MVATARAEGTANPKAAVLAELRPAVFVDDYYLPFLQGLPPSTHAALVLRQPNGSPNSGPGLEAVHSSHADRAAFAAWWLSESKP